MKKKEYKFKEKVWRGGYDPSALWYFVSIPKKETAQIKKDFGSLQKGWRSLPVMATIGNTDWKTSIFYDNHSETYSLPIKAQVRKKEGVYEKDTVSFSIKILVGEK